MSGADSPAAARPFHIGGTFAYVGMLVASVALFLLVDRIGVGLTTPAAAVAGTATSTATGKSGVLVHVLVAKTVTGPDASFFRTLTFFEENFAQTLLDGPTTGRTYVTMTPGFRFNFPTSDCWKMGHDNVLILGVDLPVSTYQPWSSTWRLSYIKVF